MKILYTSDIHASATHLSSMLSVADKEEVDCIIIGGDIVPHNLPNSLSEGHIKAHAIYLEEVFIPAVRRFRQKTGAAIYLDIGNDDFICNRKILERYDGELMHLLHFRKARLTDHVDIIGYMNVPPTPFTRKDLEKPDSPRQPFVPGNDIVLDGYTTVTGVIQETVIDLASEDTIEKDLARLSENIDRPFIFVSHSPPYNTSLDILYNGMHAGSVSIREFIREWARTGKLIASFHGHIHESPSRSGSIRAELESTLCINPGQGNGPEAGFRYVIFRLTDSLVLWDVNISQDRNIIPQMHPADP